MSDPQDAQDASSEKTEPTTDEPAYDDGDDSGWLCECGNYEDTDFHCSDCGAEPSWGCGCSFCEREVDWEDDPDFWEEDSGP